MSIKLNCPICSLELEFDDFLYEMQNIICYVCCKHCFIIDFSSRLFDGIDRIECRVNKYRMIFDFKNNLLKIRNVYDTDLVYNDSIIMPNFNNLKISMQNILNRVLDMQYLL